MKKIVCILLVTFLMTSYACAIDYVIRFENKRRIVTIPCESNEDKQNKLNQANDWAKGNPLRKVVISNDNRPVISKNNKAAQSNQSTDGNLRCIPAPAI